MRIGIFFVYTDYHRRGLRNRMSMQPQIGTLIAGHLPAHEEIEIVNETWEQIDWRRDYDLIFISAMHSDFDRARQVSHYFRRRGATTVFGGYFAMSYPRLCAPFFDAVAIGDPEGMVDAIYRDFCAGHLQPLYRATRFDAGALATPRFDLLAGRALNPLGLEATRGCPFSCEFCVLSGAGGRFHPRPVADVLRDLAAGRAMLRDRLAWFKRRSFSFTDNNLGGNPAYLRELCAALAPLRLSWVAAVTFNVITRPDLVKCMADAGCHCVFVGLESFNPATLTGMGKHQNAAHKVRAAIELCLDHGIVVMSGVMLSPLTDDAEYIRALPRMLRDCGLFVPTFLCFETPLPGTPHFTRLANAADPALMPNALLRDFNGYTLTVRPRLAALDEFVTAYKAAHAAVFARTQRLAKLAHDLPRLIRQRRTLAVAVDVADMLTMQAALKPAPGRTWIAGSEPAPPETTPLTAADFDSAQQMQAVLAPMAVTDDDGRVLPQWLGAAVSFLPRKRRRDGKPATEHATPPVTMPGGPRRAAPLAVADLRA